MNDNKLVNLIIAILSNSDKVSLTFERKKLGSSFNIFDHTHRKSLGSAFLYNNGTFRKWPASTKITGSTLKQLITRR